MKSKIGKNIILIGFCRTTFHEYFNAKIMHMNKKYITIFALSFAGYAPAQQIALNTQYLFNEMVINPAATGTKDYIPVQLNFRKQWTSFPGAPTTQIVSAQSAVFKTMGFGGMLFNDASGPSRRTGININTAYHLQLDKKNEHHLGFGLSLSLTQHLIDVTKLNTYLPEDPAVIRGYNNQMVPDANFGMFYRYKDKAFAGISVFNLIQLRKDLYNFSIPLYNPLVRTYYLIGGYHFAINENFGIKTTTLVQAIETGTWQVDATALGTYKNLLWLGASYRHKDAVAILVGGNIGAFKIGYSYDYTLSAIGHYANGSHEVFVELKLNRPKSTNSTPWLKRNRIFNPSSF
jgi:type IX secretion system PorP/SprF family membrane protein